MTKIHILFEYAQKHVLFSSNFRTIFFSFRSLDRPSLPTTDKRRFRPQEANLCPHGDEPVPPREHTFVHTAAHLRPQGTTGRPITHDKRPTSRADTTKGVEEGRRPSVRTRSSTPRTATPRQRATSVGVLAAIRSLAKPLADALQETAYVHSGFFHLFHHLAGVAVESRFGIFGL